jgi:Flp pilus assembly pilin Flp
MHKLCINSRNQEKPSNKTLPNQERILKNLLLKTLTPKLSRCPQASKGQGMMEYIVIVALIAVAAIGVYSAFGQTVRNQSAGLAKELSGNAADTKLSTDSANSAAGRANDPSKTGMGQYNYANDAK